MLTDNPDIATLWNYRREIVITSLQARLVNHTPYSFTHILYTYCRSVEEGCKICEVEQLLTQQCLRVNPKSYCVWLHRQWIMEHSPQPDWTAERQLCDLFLKYDERNCK